MSGIESIAKQILQEAAKIGGQTWSSIENAAPLYVRGYAQSLVDIASGVASGDITKKDGEIYTKNALLILVMGITNVAQVVLHAVQALLDKVISILRAAINAALPIAIL